jgi:hypothetical protein
LSKLNPFVPRPLSYRPLLNHGFCSNEESSYNELKLS